MLNFAYLAPVEMKCAANRETLYQLEHRKTNEVSKFKA